MAALLAVALLAGGAAAAKSAAKTSELWGKAGEKWTPDGLLMDFSYAGVGCKRQQPHAAVPAAPGMSHLPMGGGQKPRALLAAAAGL